MRISDDSGNSKYHLKLYFTYRKFDLEGIGSITTQQLIEQLGLTNEGKSKSMSIKPVEYKFPQVHRAKYDKYNGQEAIMVWTQFRGFAI